MSQPVYSTADGYIGESFFTITFGQALDNANPPPLSAFEVQVNGTDVTVTGITVDSVAKTVQLTINTTLLPGDIIDFVYTDPTVANDVSAVQGLDGTDAASFSHSTVVAITRPICYLRGTLILTDRGEVPIESLRIGDTVVTRRGGLQAIKWIGRQSFGRRVFDWRGAPIRISAEALGAGLPRRDLWISPGHSMLIGETLLLGQQLVNGVTIIQDLELDQVEYFQLETEAHDCVLAEGAWSETYADGPGLRSQFHNAAEFHVLYPDHVVPAEPQLCAPRPEWGPALEAALRPVVQRAAALVVPGPLRASIDLMSESGRLEGWALDLANPELPVLLEVVLDGEVLATVLAANYRHDLFVAGFGRGYCSYSIELQRHFTLEERMRLVVRRAADGAQAGLTPEARMSAPRAEASVVCHDQPARSPQIAA